MSFILACVLFAANVDNPTGGSVIIEWQNGAGETGEYGNDVIRHDFCVYEPDKSLGALIGFREGNDILAMRGGPVPEYRFIARDPESGRIWKCSSSDSHETVNLKRNPASRADSYTIVMNRKDIPVRVTLSFGAKST
jgi:hypothetical protein